jgi:hypothetical protein
VRSPFVRRGASLGERPWGENPGIMRGAIFSEGRGLRVRKCGPDASRGITYSWGANDGPVAKRKYAPAKRKRCRRACGARPSAGWATRAGMALRGKPGDNAGGGFLGGTHSVRPRGEAIRKPRHNIIIGGKRTFGGLMG